MNTGQYHKLYYWLAISQASTSYKWKHHPGELGSWIKDRLDNQRAAADNGGVNHDSLIFFAVTVQS